MPKENVQQDDELLVRVAIVVSKISSTDSEINCAMLNFKLVYNERACMHVYISLQ